MGGIIFLIPISIVSILLAKGPLDFVMAVVLSTLGFGLIGFWMILLRLLSAVLWG